MVKTLEILSNINQWWQSEGAGLLNDIARLKREISEKNDEITEIQDAKAGYNPLRFLSNTWSRAVNAPQLDKVKKSLERNKENSEGILTSRAESDSDNLLAVLSENIPHLSAQLEKFSAQRSALEDNRNCIGEIKTRTKNMLSSIEEVQIEAKNAQKWEMADMAVSNIALTLGSHMKTSEVKEKLEGVGEELQDYKEFMKSAYSKLSSLQLTSLRAESIAEIAQWDLFMGALDLDIISFFTSWRNHEQLGKAREKLESLSALIEPILEFTDSELSGVESELSQLRKEYVALRADAISDINLPKPLMAYMEKPDSNVAEQNLDAKPNISIN